jgi:glucose-1-phosphate thymidylyltransferase
MLKKMKLSIVTTLYKSSEYVDEFYERISKEAQKITTLNQMYLERGDLNVELLGRGFAWLDTGTHESLLEAAMFVETIEKRQGYKIACLEEIAWNNGWITRKQLFDFGKKLEKNSYGKYLMNMAKDI